MIWWLYDNQSLKSIYCHIVTKSLFILWNGVPSDWPVGQAVTRSSLEREVWDSNLGPVKSDTVLPMARHRCDISSNGAVFPGRNDAKMGSTNFLHA